MKTPTTATTVLVELRRHPEGDVDALIEDLAGPLTERVLTRSPDPAAARALALDILAAFFNAARPLMRVTRACEIAAAMDAASVRSALLAAATELREVADLIGDDHTAATVRRRAEGFRARSGLNFRPNHRPHKP